MLADRLKLFCCCFFSCWPPFLSIIAGGDSMIVLGRRTSLSELAAFTKASQIIAAASGSVGSRMNGLCPHISQKAHPEFPDGLLYRRAYPAAAGLSRLNRRPGSLVASSTVSGGIKASAVKTLGMPK